jgi:adenosylcobinamide-GDP ribazoletransferase
VREVLAALKFQVRAPLRPYAAGGVPGEAAAGGAAAFFPLAGLAVGGAAWLCDWGFVGFGFPRGLRDLAVVAVLAAPSGGFHARGLARSAPALIRGRGRRQSLTATGGAGAVGAVVLLLVLALKVLALGRLAGGYRTIALFLSPALGRWAVVVTAYGSRPASVEGWDRSFVRAVRFREFGLASVLALGSTFAAAEVLALAVLIPVAALVLLLRRGCERRLGGVTGETLGAAGELGETASLILFALAARLGARGG